MFFCALHIFAVPKVHFSNLTNPFTILEHGDRKIGEFYVFQKRRTTDFEALKLLKGLPGTRINEDETIETFSIICDTSGRACALGSRV